MAQARLSRFARTFVGIVFISLAISFWVSLGTIVVEFKEPELGFILTSNSNLFVFFATLGVVALAAFYVPAVIFTDLYWRRHVRYGRERFILGCMVVAGLSVYLSENMNATQRRPIWEIAPVKLEQEAGRPGTCAKEPRPGCRPAWLDVARELRAHALDRVQLSPLVRDCSPDPLLERPSTDNIPRYCFPANQMLSASACCSFQKRLLEDTFGAWSTPSQRSEAGKLDRLIFLPLKCFFVIVIILIGLFLIRWKSRLIEHYQPLLPAMERGLQIGALAMLPWMIMDYAHQQASDLIYGPRDVGFPLRMSLVLIPWALLLAGYFATRIQIELVRMVQLVSAVLSAIAILNYRELFDWSAKAFGVSAPTLHFIILAVLSAAALLYLLRWIPGALRGEDKGAEAPTHSIDERPFS